MKILTIKLGLKMILLYKKLMCGSLFIAGLSFGGVAAGTFVYPEVLNPKLRTHAERYFKMVFGDNYEDSNQKTILFVKKYLERRIMFANSTDLARQEIFRVKGSVTAKTNMLAFDEQLYADSKEPSNDSLPLLELFCAKTVLCFLWMVNEMLGLDLSYLAFEIKKSKNQSNFINADDLYKFLAHPELPMLMDNEKRRLWEVSFEKSVEKNYSDPSFIKRVLPTSKKCAEWLLFVIKCSYKS